MGTNERIDANMRVYSAVRAVPQSAVKPIKGGSYGAAGLSDINPQWRIERMTELFGPVGTGWTWEPVEVTEREGVLYGHVVVRYYDKDGKESKPIHGYGGTKFGGRDDSDIYKSTMTDAVSNALRYLGVGADVWYKPDRSGDQQQYDTKYSAPPEVAQTITDEQKDSISKLVNADEWLKLEEKYGTDLGLMTQECYHKVLAKLKARKEGTK
jgi:hypothetical protein